MSRKDYELIANVFRVTCNNASIRGDVVRLKKPDSIVLTALADNLVAELARDNPRFDKERFIAACFKGVEK